MSDVNNSMPEPTREGAVSSRTLNFFWLIDHSGSMSGAKIHSLNSAIPEAIEAIRSALANYPKIKVKMKAIRFSTTASWHIGPEAVDLENFSWPSLTAEGTTATADAIEMLCGELDIEKMSRRAVPPVCILMSDGFCTQSAEEYEAAIEKLDSLPWGKKAIRLVIAIGQDDEYDEAELLKFTNHPEVGLLRATDADTLTAYIKWASTAASIASSKPSSHIDPDQQAGGINTDMNVVLTPPPSIPNGGIVF